MVNVPGSMLGRLKATSITEQQAEAGLLVIVVDPDHPTDQNYWLLGQIDSEYFEDYKAAFWPKAKSDEDKPVWISPPDGKLLGVDERACNYEFRLSNLRMLIIEHGIDMGDGVIMRTPVLSSQWISVIMNTKMGTEVSWLYTKENHADAAELL